MLIEWNVSPIIFDLGPLQLRWYGLMFIIGFTIGYQLMKKACLWENKPINKLDDLLTYLVIGTLVGARLGHCIFYDFNYYFSNPLNILKIWEGGLASHGGGLGVIIAIYLFSRKHSAFPFWWLVDRIAIFTVMTGGFIRLGNLMNSEILGKPTDGSWGFIFQKVDQIPRHPAMIYESICYFLIFILSYTIYVRHRAKIPPRFLAGLVISLISICRIVIEFFKEPQSAFETDMILDMGQWLSIPFLIFGLYLIYRSRSKSDIQKTKR